MKKERQWLWGVPGLTTPLAVMLASWLLLVGVSTVIYAATGRHINTCGFRLSSGYPCVACGGTRAALSLVRGDVGGALRFNPAAAILLLTLPILAAAWALGARWRRPSHRGLRIGLIALATAGLLANWAYVLTHLPALERGLRSSVSAS